ncbi:MAG: hypothetical protein Q8M26_10305 [Pseudolabrys sp.]|nr:hypothetical protein [Pseudolabrys sp.]
MSKAKPTTPQRNDMSPDAKKSDVGQDPKKPVNLRANAMPTDGFVLSVDGKLKTQFETEADATAAAEKLKQAYPVIQVSVYDAIKRVYTPVELAGK